MPMAIQALIYSLSSQLFFVPRLLGSNPSSVSVAPQGEEGKKKEFFSMLSSSSERRVYFGRRMSLLPWTVQSPYKSMVRGTGRILLIGKLRCRVAGGGNT